jgi:hypothetical protein
MPSELMCPNPDGMLPTQIVGEEASSSISSAFVSRRRPPPEEEDAPHPMRARRCAQKWVAAAQR